ncbi:MAG: winged helix-turn-helix domain-containing protein [Candidatus Odinarchaeia archaeon]
MSEINNLIKNIIKQNEIIISLLGRKIFKEEEIREIIIKNKKNELKDNYVKGYNSCDGSKTITQLSNIIGVSQPTLSGVIKEWEEEGIVYEIYKPGGKYYKKILKISE